MKKLFCVLSILFCVFLSCAPAQQLRVTAAEGINLRDAPSADGKVLALVPGGAEVTFLSEIGDTLTIQGATGKWTQVQWQDKQGWVFGGFLAKIEPLAGEPAGARAAIEFVCANSVLFEENHHFHYSPYQVFDNNPLTAWAEGDQDVGIGKQLSIRFKNSVPVDAIRIMPGFFNPQWHKANNRVKSLDIEFPGSTSSMTVELADSMTEQEISLPPTAVTGFFSFTIKDVYRGSEYNDTCISEISFYYRGVKIRIMPNDIMTMITSAPAGSFFPPRGKKATMVAKDRCGSEYFFADGTYVETSCRKFSMIRGVWEYNSSTGKAIIRNPVTCMLEGIGPPLASEGYFYENYEYKEKPIAPFEIEWGEYIITFEKLGGRGGYEFEFITDAAESLKTRPTQEEISAEIKNIKENYQLYKEGKYHPGL